MGILSLIYKPAYSVTLDGKFVGYISDKSALQKEINNYMRKGDGANLSFIDIAVLPEYNLCLVKKDTETNDNKILSDVEASGTAYYKYYAIVVGQEEKYYVGSKQDAESIIEKLKSENSTNIDTIAYTEINSTELKAFTDNNTVQTALYVAPPPVKPVIAVGGGSSKASAGYTGVADRSYKPTLGISVIQPISGIITAGFRDPTYPSHSGLDIAGPVGTTIVAAAGGTVEAAGSSGSGYGIYVKINCGNGVEMLYAHTSKVFVEAGDYVSQGQPIAARGSTGHSTGSHLHFEIRINGEAVNPRNYVY
ncbi:MAG: M23 family metallopeptidase [Firmicutes bacterium]|nr:M23 family metallopeptidase [Bacillota bacterium]